MDLPEVRWLRARDAAPGHGPLGPLKKWTRGVPPYFRFPRVGLAIGAATQHLGPEPLCGRPQREPRNRPPVGLEACDGCNIWAQMMMMTIMLTMMMTMMMVMVMMMVVVMTQGEAEGGKREGGRRGEEESAGRSAIQNEDPTHWRVGN